MKPLIVTIDGPAGAGKTTVSRMLARQLGYQYIDTGALYRGVAFEVKAAAIPPDDDEKLEELCGSLKLRLKTAGEKPSIHLTVAFATPSLTAPTAGRDLPLSRISPMIGR